MRNTATRSNWCFGLFHGRHEWRRSFQCLRRISPDVRVILVSGSDKAVAKRMLADGLRAFLSKPFLPEELLDVMRGEINADLRCHAESFAT